MPMPLLRRLPGRRTRSPGASGRAQSAIGELSNAIADGDLAGLQLFEKLTGTEQLWWRCCRDAAQSQPSWVLYGDHDKALQVIRDTEFVASRGAISRAAETVDLICQALAARAGDAHPASPLTEVIARAADCWNGCPAVLTAGETGFKPQASAACVVPYLQDRVKQILACLDSVSTDARQAMTAICTLLLAAERAHTGRVVAVPVVFARPGDRSATARGVAGILELREFPFGPAGLFPDPRGMRNRRADARFDAGLRLAWQFAAGADQGKRCVLWQLSLDGGIPDYAIDGGSLGAAFAVALRELLRQPPRQSRAAIPAALRTFFVGLRPGCAITGVLAPQRPSAYDKLTSRFAEGPWLDQVGDMDAKIDAAKRKGLRLVAPTANRAHSQALDPRTVRFAATVNEAERYARHWNAGRLAITAVIFATAVATAAAFTYQSYRNSAAIGQQDAIRVSQNLGQYLISRMNATSLSSVDPASMSIDPLSPDSDGLLAVDAYRTAPTQPAVQALFDSYAQLSAYQSVIGYYPGGEEEVSADQAGTVAVVWQPDSTDVWLIPGQPSGKRLAGRVLDATDAAVSPDGSRVATTSNGQIQVWQTYPFRRLLDTDMPPGGGSDAYALTFSPDSRYLGILSYNFSVFVWNLASRHVNRMPVPPSVDEPFDDVGFTSAGDVYAASTDGDATYSWNPITGKLIATQSGTPSGLAGDDIDIRAACADVHSHPHWTFIESATGRSVRGLPTTVPCDTDSTAEALDGNFLATVTPADSPAAGGQAQIASVINLRTGKKVSEADLPPDSSIAGLSPSGQRMLIQGACFGIARLTHPGNPLAPADPGDPFAALTSPDGHFIAQPAEPRPSSPVLTRPEIRIINPSSGVIVHTLTLPLGDRPPNSVDGYLIDSVAFLPDGSLLAMANGILTLWDVRTGTMISAPVALRSRLNAPARPDPIIAVGLGAPDEIAMTGPDGHTVEVWQTGKWRLLRIIGPIHDTIDSISFNPNGHSVVITTDNGFAEVFSVRSGARLGVMPLPISVSGVFVAALAHGYTAMISQSVLSIWRNNTQIALLRAPAGLALAYFGTSHAVSDLVIGMKYTSDTSKSPISVPFEISPNPAMWALSICAKIDRSLNAQELASPGFSVPTRGC